MALLDLALKKNLALNTQQVVIGPFPRVGINRKPHSVNPSFLGLEGPINHPVQCAILQMRKLRPPTSGLGREVRSEAETCSSAASVESYSRLSIRDSASDLGEHSV